MWIIERNFCLNGLMNVLENKVFKPKILNLLPLKIITPLKKCDPFRVEKINLENILLKTCDPFRIITHLKITAIIGYRNVILSKLLR